MNSSEPARADIQTDADVHPLSRAARRPCSRPGCPAPARATLTFAYAERQAWIERLQDAKEPQAYDLCATHAGRTRPPHGWQLRDRRPDEDRQEDHQIDSPPVTPTDLGSERTVAVLAAALRAVPDIAPERDDRQPQPSSVASDDAGASAAAPDQPELVGPAAGGSTRAPGDRTPTLLDAVGGERQGPRPRPPMAVRDHTG